MDSADKELLFKLRVDTTEITKLKQLLESIKFSPKLPNNAEQLVKEENKKKLLQLKEKQLTLQEQRLRFQIQKHQDQDIKKYQKQDTKKHQEQSTFLTPILKRLAPLAVLTGIYKICGKIWQNALNQFEQTKGFSRMSYYLSDVRQSKEAYKLMNSAAVNPYIKQAIFPELSNLAYAKAEKQVRGVSSSPELEVMLNYFGTSLIEPMDTILQKIKETTKMLDKNTAFIIGQSGGIGNIVQTYQRMNEFGKGFQQYTKDSLKAFQSIAHTQSNISSMTATIQSAVINVASKILDGNIKVDERFMPKEGGSYEWSSMLGSTIYDLFKSRNSSSVQNNNITNITNNNITQHSKLDIDVQNKRNKQELVNNVETNLINNGLMIS